MSDTAGGERSPSASRELANKVAAAAEAITPTVRDEVAFVADISLDTRGYAALAVRDDRESWTTFAECVQAAGQPEPTRRHPIVRPDVVVREVPTVRWFTTPTPRGNVSAGVPTSVEELVTLGFDLDAVGGNLDSTDPGERARAACALEVGRMPPILDRLGFSKVADGLESVLSSSRDADGFAELQQAYVTCMNTAGYAASDPDTLFNDVVAGTYLGMVAAAQADGACRGPLRQRFFELRGRDWRTWLDDNRSEFARLRLEKQAMLVEAGLTEPD